MQNNGGGDSFPSAATAWGVDQTCVEILEDISNDESSDAMSAAGRGTCLCRNKTSGERC